MLNLPADFHIAGPDQIEELKKIHYESEQNKLALALLADIKSRVGKGITELKCLHPNRPDADHLQEVKSVCTTFGWDLTILDSFTFKLIPSKQQ